MTHSIFVQFIAMIVAAAFAAAILWGEHYHPWGVKLDQRMNYVLGTLAMMTPFSLLVLFWMLLPPPGNLGVWVLAGVWVIVAVSGCVVHIFYETDAKREMSQRAKAAEAAEKAARDEPA